MSSDEREIECSDPVTASVEVHSWHDDVLRQAVVGHVKAAEWKRMLGRQLRPPDGCDFLNLITKILSVHSNVGVASCRELIAATVQVGACIMLELQ